MLEKREVFIPLVAPKGAPGPVARIEAEGVLPANNIAELPPEIAPLLQCGLQSAGMRARDIMRRHPLARPRLAPWRLLARRAPVYSLSAANVDEVKHLAPENAASAELGLALAMAIYLAGVRTPLIAATGALTPTNTQGAGARVRYGEVTPVYPVAGLGAKMAALAEALGGDGRRAHLQDRGRRRARLVFLLPERTLDGRPVREAHATDIVRLQSRLADAGIALDLRPVGTFPEALAVLGLKREALRPADYLIGGAFAAGLVALLMTGAASTWLSRPIPLAFGEIKLAKGAGAVVTPARLRSEPVSGRFVLRPGCLGAQRMPLYRAGDWMAVDVRPQKSETLTRLFGGYHYTLVVVSERSGLKVFPPETLARGNSPLQVQTQAAGREPTGGLSVALPLKGPREENKLIILASRIWSVDPERLRERFGRVYEKAPAGSKINAVVAAASQAAAGYLDVSFMTVTEPLPCEAVTSAGPEVPPQANQQEPGQERPSQQADGAAEGGG